MLSKKSAGDLEACSVLAKQVLNAARVILEACSLPRALKAWRHFATFQLPELLLALLLNAHIKNNEFNPVNYLMRLLCRSGF